MEKEGEDGEKLKEELIPCQHLLVDTEIEKGRHKVFNLQMTYLDDKVKDEKLNEVFNKVESAAEINIALGFVIGNEDTGEYRCYYAYKNNTSFEKMPLLCTKADLIRIQGENEMFDIGDQCPQERQNTKWRSMLIKNATVFAALLKTSQREVRNLSCLNHYYDIQK